MSDLGFAIVGAGNIAPLHAQSIAEIQGARLKAVVDVVSAKAESLALRHGATALGDYRMLLSTSDIDAVCLCVPSGLRCEIAETFAAAGKHILCEKPLEVSIDRCDRIIAAAQGAGVQLACVFQNRFTDSAIAVRRAVEAGRFGKLLMGDAYVKWYRSQAYYDGDAWRGTWDLDGGGVLMNQGIHYIDMLMWFMGPVRSVWARTATMAHDRLPVEDVACVLLEFESGALGTIEGSTGIWSGHPARVEVHGTEGTAVIEDGKLAAWRFKQESPEDQSIRDAFAAETTLGSGAGDPIAGLNYAGHKRQIADFVEAIRGQRPPLIEGREARKAVAIIEAIYESARSGKAVLL